MIFLSPDRSAVEVAFNSLGRRWRGAGENFDYAQARVLRRGAGEEPVGQVGSCGVSSQTKAVGSSLPPAGSSKNAA